MSEPIMEVLPSPSRCQGRCGKGAICSEMIFRNAYCLEPKLRMQAMQNLPEDVQEKIRNMNWKTFG